MEVAPPTSHGVVSANTTLRLLVSPLGALAARIRPACSQTRHGDMQGDSCGRDGQLSGVPGDGKGDRTPLLRVLPAATDRCRTEGLARAVESRHEPAIHLASLCDHSRVAFAVAIAR